MAKRKKKLKKSFNKKRSIGAYQQGGLAGGTNSTYPDFSQFNNTWDLSNFNYLPGKLDVHSSNPPLNGKLDVHGMAPLNALLPHLQGLGDMQNNPGIFKMNLSQAMVKPTRGFGMMPYQTGGQVEDPMARMQDLQKAYNMPQYKAPVMGTVQQHKDKKISDYDMLDAPQVGMMKLLTGEAQKPGEYLKARGYKQVPQMLGDALADPLNLIPGATVVKAKNAKKSIKQIEKIGSKYKEMEKKLQDLIDNGNPFDPNDLKKLQDQIEAFGKVRKDLGKHVEKHKKKYKPDPYPVEILKDNVDKVITGDAIFEAQPHISDILEKAGYPKVENSPIPFRKHGGKVSDKARLGYSDGSPYAGEDSIRIPGGLVDMSQTSQPLIAVTDTGETMLLPPNSGTHRFKGARYVTEYPLSRSPLAGLRIPRHQYGGYTEKPEKPDHDFLNMDLYIEPFKVPYRDEYSFSHPDHGKLTDITEDIKLVDPMNRRVFSYDDIAFAKKAKDSKFGESFLDPAGYMYSRRNGKPTIPAQFNNKIRLHELIGQNTAKLDKFWQDPKTVEKMSRFTFDDPKTAKLFLTQMRGRIDPNNYVVRMYGDEHDNKTRGVASHTDRMRGSHFKAKTGERVPLKDLKNKKVIQLNHDSADYTTPAHELSHVADSGSPVFTMSKHMDKYRFNEDYFNDKEEWRNAYVAEPTETRARVISTRVLLEDLGIKKMTEDLTQKDIEKIFKKVNKQEKSKNWDAIKDLMQISKGETKEEKQENLRRLLNEIVSNDKPRDPHVRTAQYGGFLSENKGTVNLPDTEKGIRKTVDHNIKKLTAFWNDPRTVKKLTKLTGDEKAAKKYLSEMTDNIKRENVHLDVYDNKNALWGYTARVKDPTIDSSYPLKSGGWLHASKFPKGGVMGVNKQGNYGTVPHEISHVADQGFPIKPLVDRMDKYRHSPDTYLKKSEHKSRYYADPSETRSRVITIRRLMEENGLKPMTDDLQRGDMDTLFKRIDSDSPHYWKSAKELMQVIKGSTHEEKRENLRKLLNEIVMNNDKKQDPQVRMAQYGGFLPKFQMGGTVGAPQPQMIPIQTEKGEKIVMPSGDIFDVKANKLHKHMDPREVTDVLPQGAYIASNDKSTRINRKDAEKITFGMTPVQYKESGEIKGKSIPEEMSFADIFGKKKHLLPAELARKIQNKFRITDREQDLFAIKAQEENLSSRIPYNLSMQAIAEFNKTQSRHARQHQDELALPAPPMEGQGEQQAMPMQAPAFQLGGFTGMNLSGFFNKLINDIPGVQTKDKAVMGKQIDPYGVLTTGSGSMPGMGSSGSFQIGGFPAWLGHAIFGGKKEKKKNEYLEQQYHDAADQIFGLYDTQVNRAHDAHQRGQDFIDDAFASQQKNLAMGTGVGLLGALAQNPYENREDLSHVYTSVGAMKDKVPEYVKDQQRRALQAPLRGMNESAFKYSGNYQNTMANMSNNYANSLGAMSNLEANQAAQDIGLRNQKLGALMNVQGRDASNLANQQNAIRNNRNANYSSMAGVGVNHFNQMGVSELNKMSNNLYNEGALQNALANADNTQLAGIGTQLMGAGYHQPNMTFMENLADFSLDQSNQLRNMTMSMLPMMTGMPMGAPQVPQSQTSQSTPQSSYGPYNSGYQYGNNSTSPTGGNFNVDNWIGLNNNSTSTYGPYSSGYVPQITANSNQPSLFNIFNWLGM